MALASTSSSYQDPQTPSSAALASSDRNKHWWRMIGRALSALLTRSSDLEEGNTFFETLITPSLGSLSDDPSSSTPPASNPSTAEFVPIIRSFIHSPSCIAFARNLQGEEARELIDIVDQATAVPELDEKLRKQCLHLLYKMCKDCKTLPTSYSLQQGPLCVGAICSYGGFADINIGDYLGRRVAIKRLRFWAQDGHNRLFKRFCQEIMVWKRLSHPNILPLLGVSFSADLYSFLMVSAWMKNGNVMEYTRSNPGANRLQLLSGVMSGASYLHGLGVVHGDLKGANILVDDDGTALLADFGLATISVDLSTIPLSATAASSAGTIPWMSPELLLGQNSSPTPQSDSYALGMVVYEVLTGRRPFHRLAPYPVVIAVQKGERPNRPVNARSLGLSDRLWGLVVWCWDESPSNRPTAQDLLYCLQDISPAWEPPLEYPIPDDPDGEVGSNFMSRGGWSMVVGALTSGFLALLVVVLCVFVFSLR